MSGTEKLLLLLIGKLKNLRCFKGIKILPVNYQNNKKDWMTTYIFICGLFANLFVYGR